MRADWAYGYDPRTGEELWKINGILGFSNLFPFHRGYGMFYISTCFMKAEIHATGLGLDTSTRLENDQVELSNALSLVGREELYVMNDGGIFS